MQLLKDLPDVTVQENFSTGSVNQINIRGISDNRKLLILKDGIRLNIPGGDLIGVAGNYSLYSAKRVEFIYGSASDIYGSDAVSGVVNIITQTTEDFEGTRVTLGSGLENYQYADLTSHHQLNGDWSVRFGGHFEQEESFDLSEHYASDFPQQNAITFDGTIVEPAGNRDYEYSPLKNYDLNLTANYKDAWELGYIQSYDRESSQVSSTPTGALFDESANLIRTVQQIYGKYKTDLSKDLYSETSLNYGVWKFEEDSYYRNKFSAFEKGYKYGATQKTQLEQQLIWNLSRKHTLNGGVVFEDYDHIPRTSDLPSAYDNSKASDNQSFHYTNTNLPIEIIHKHYQNYGIYLQEKSKWTSDLTTTIGGRYDNHSIFGETFNPKLGLTYMMTPKTVTKLTYGQATLSPLNRAYTVFGSFNGQQDANSNWISPFFNTPNEDLKPEKTQNFEWSLQSNLSHSLNAGFSVYYNQTDDVIFQQPTADINQFISGAIIQNAQAYVNAGKSEVTGLSVNLEQATMIWDTETQWWASYSYNQGSLTEPDGTVTDLPYLTPNIIKLGTTVNWTRDLFSTLQLRWNDETYALKKQNGSNKKRMTADSFLETDLHLGAQLNKIFKAYLDIYNLFDQRYYHASVEETGTFDLSPQNPRQIRLYLQAKF